MSVPYLRKTVRASAILTTDYVAGTVLWVDTEAYPDRFPKNQIVIDVAFTLGSLDYGLIKLEFSHDGTTYFQEVTEGVSGGVITDTLAERKLPATGNYSIPVPIKAQYVKISAKGSGTVTNSLMAINATLGVQ